MHDSKSMDTSLVNHFNVFTDLSPQIEEENKYMSHILYASTVRSLMYDMVCTRSDISHDVSVVSRYMEHSRKTHGQVVK